MYQHIAQPNTNYFSLNLQHMLFADVTSVIAVFEQTLFKSLQFTLFIILQRTFCVLKVVVSTWVFGDAIGCLRQHLRGLGRRMSADRLWEVIWQLLTTWIYKTSSTTPSQCEKKNTFVSTCLTHTILRILLIMFSCWCRKTTVWVWVKESIGGSEQTGIVDPVNGAWCPQMALGSPEQWRKAPCDARYLFLCENDVTGKAKRSGCTYGDNIRRMDFGYFLFA